MDTEPLVFVGIDWASTEHQVCLTGAGDPVQRAFAYDAGGIGAMVDWLGAQAEQPNQVRKSVHATAPRADRSGSASASRRHGPGSAAWSG